jgi:hypothetical protein
MARLDRLHSVKEIAQIGAVICRDFTYSLIRAVASRDETALKYALGELEQAELVYRYGELPDAVYRFKHALVRDAAYESLLKRRRQHCTVKLPARSRRDFRSSRRANPLRTFQEPGQCGRRTSNLEDTMRY